MMLKMLAASMWVLALPVLSLAQAGEPGFLNGVDANYSVDTASKGTAWEGSRQPADLFTLLHRNGVDSLRVRVWTADQGMSSRAYALDLAAKAQPAGLKPYLVLFLSDNWSDYVKQPAPAAWQNLPLDEKAMAAQQHSQLVAQNFVDAAINVDLYEIGNEIDSGICGEFEQDWGNRTNTTHMKQQVWPKAAAIIRAAEAGVRKANPKARFILHLAQWWNPAYVNAFVKAMSEQEVQIDYVGLTFYPTSGLAPQNTFAALEGSVRQINQATGKRVIICEYAYPSVARFGGQFATWNKPVAGYPLTEAGQQKWIGDFLSFCRGREQIAGAFYWSPEWYPEEMWQAFALFGADGHAKPGLGSLKP